VLLWPAYCRALIALQAQGVHPAEAQRRAADRVTVHQLEVIAQPRRFTLPMQEIWLLQARFSQRKRVGRLLAHPRFRAAFDFLVLRQVASPDHAGEVAFWRDAQRDAGLADAGIEDVDGDGGSEGDELLDGDADTEAGKGVRTPRRRRRRRRPGGNDGGQSGTA
jgi:poly(A) polymerase